MQVGNLGLGSGDWLGTNCADLPSDNNCKLVMFGPASQRSDLLEASVAHAVATHGAEDTPELRAELDKLITPVSE